MGLAARFNLFLVQNFKKGCIINKGRDVRQITTILLSVFLQSIRLPKSKWAKAIRSWYGCETSSSEAFKARGFLLLILSRIWQKLINFFSVKSAKEETHSFSFFTDDV